MAAPTPDPQLPLGSVADWAVALLTLLAVVVALFKEEIVSWWRSPKLSASIALRPPDCSKTTLTYVVQNVARTFGAAECYYLRLWVENQGRTRAEKVQVYAAKLRRRTADGSFKEVEDFLPMNLRWAHGQQNVQGPEIFAEGISPEMGKHCDLGYVVDPQHRSSIGENLPGVGANRTLLVLDLEVKPNTLTHLVPPGVYQLVLRIAAANCRPIPKTLEINITGDWYTDQERMFSDGLGVRLLD